MKDFKAIFNTYSGKLKNTIGIKKEFGDKFLHGGYENDSQWYYERMFFSKISSLYFLNEYLSQKKFSSVLEIGCSIGLLPKFMNNVFNNVEYTGLDLSEKSLTLAKKILLGDLNIAPLENDVWSHKQLLKVVSHTPIEIEYLEKLKLSQNWVDAVRHFIPSTEKLYSWWSYRARDWKKSNRGRRLAHIWVTPALTKHLSSASVLSEVRGWHKPSDHVPVILNIKI